MGFKTVCGLIFMMTEINQLFVEHVIKQLLIFCSLEEDVVPKEIILTLLRMLVLLYPQLVLRLNTKQDYVQSVLPVNI